MGNGNYNVRKQLDIDYHKIFSTNNSDLVSGDVFYLSEHASSQPPCTYIEVKMLASDEVVPQVFRVHKHDKDIYYVTGENGAIIPAYLIQSDEVTLFHCNLNTGELNTLHRLQFTFGKFILTRMVLSIKFNLSIHILHKAKA